MTLSFITFFAFTQEAGAVSSAAQSACFWDYMSNCSQYSLTSPKLGKCMENLGPKVSRPCIHALLVDKVITKAQVVERFKKDGLVFVDATIEESPSSTFGPTVASSPVVYTPPPKAVWKVVNKGKTVFRKATTKTYGVLSSLFGCLTSVNIKHKPSPPRTGGVIEFSGASFGGK